ncbi:MAG TPA: hypothetical protein EYN14_18080 [Alphaproteobacteria bacterium]|jgi:hypothetical protein|uniref:hypothetical protein n=1 Tax=Marinobacter salarius TaxID=1420917 RepID=UPI0018F25C24|nr:hypothetical protein [Marinobacter salarius]MBJ7302662.1 hypothetical protein [Marinobacter salarius]HIO03834.1 hypothetical protein [Alphaproteobacteria bacterium]
MNAGSRFIETRSDNAIGGYHGLELPFIESNLNKTIVRTNSARSAIKVILNAVCAQKIWLPAYTCDAVVEAVKDLGIAFKYYKITSNFDVETIVNLGEGEYILVIDYFGMADELVKRSLKRFGHANTIVDCSQAFYSKHNGSLATVWSPRKFFGLPDGGLLYSDDYRVQQPKTRDSTSDTRMDHLISSLTNGPEAAYRKYLESEQAIADLPVMGMSSLTERLLHSVDYEAAKTIRARNARYLHDRLAKYNQIDLTFNEDTAPLCYPFLPKVKAASRSDLISNRVFVPRYWPEVLARVGEDSFEWRLVTNGLFLPCDQRHTESDMDRLVSLLEIQ